MPDAVTFIFGGGADLLGIGGHFREQRLEVNPAVRGPHRVERDHRLREQVYRGLTPAAFEAQMKRGGDAIECAGEFLQFLLDLSRRVLEALRRVEVFAAVERLDCEVEFVLAAGAVQSSSFSSTARNSSSLSARALRVPYFS